MTADEAANALHISSLVIAESLIHLNDPDVAPPTVPSWICKLLQWWHVALRAQVRKGDRCGRLRRLEEGTGVEAVSGLGDDAVWYPAKTTLYILKGDRLVTIMPMGGPDPTLTLEVAKAIGAIVVTRLSTTAVARFARGSGEGAGRLAHRLPRLACSRSIASNSALKLPTPKPREPWRSMISKKKVGRSWTGRVKICRR